MILFFDTETTGLYWDRLPADHHTQPHMVQLGLLLTEPDGKVVSEASLIVNPGVPIPAKAEHVHGIGDALATAAGINEITAFGLFCFFAARADVVCAHNIVFDLNVMTAASHRARKPMIFGASKFCTMEAASPITNLPPSERMVKAGRTGPKPPKLAECIKHFFGEELEDAHDAMADVRACARVYFHLKSLEKAA